MLGERIGGIGDFGVVKMPVPNPVRGKIVAQGGGQMVDGRGPIGFHAVRKGSRFRVKSGVDHEVRTGVTDLMHFDGQDVFARLEGAGYRGHYTNGFGTLDDMLEGRRYLVERAREAGVDVD